MKTVYLMLLVIHIVAGFIGMYGGIVPLLTRKGGKAHRKWGLVFTWAMGIAATTAFPLAWLRSDLFQVIVGLFSGYLTLYGYRVLHRYKHGVTPLLDWGAAIVAATAFLITVVGSSYLLCIRPMPEARAGLVFGLIGLLVAGNDLQGLIARNNSFARRIRDHFVASTLALVSAFSAFLNTQFYRLTHLEWALDAKMLLPFAIALPLMAYWLPVWIVRLRIQRSVGDILRHSGEERSEREWMRAFGVVEGITFILLVGIAVPLKHLGGHPEFVRVMGSVHGAMFVLYSVSVILAGRALKWPLRQVAVSLGAGVLPFGTFVLEARSQALGESGQ